MFTRAFTSLFVVLISSGSAFARSPIVVSDIDDTVRITNVLDFDEATRNLVLSRRVFPGMAKLYSFMARETGSLVFLSGTPKFLEPIVEDVLRENGFPPARLYLWDLLPRPRTLGDFKRERLEDLDRASPERTLLLVGDDAQKDPEIFSRFSLENPGSVQSIYIHRIVGRVAPSGVKTYHTAFEIALREFSEGRISESEAREVGIEVLTSDSQLVFPDFAECPREVVYPTSSVIQSSSSLQSLIHMSRKHWSRFCADRHKE